MTVEDGAVRLRRADPGDVEFLLELARDEDVEPFLGAAAPKTREGVRAEVERSSREPEEFGRFVVELHEGGRWRRAGTVGFEVANRRSRIASLERLAVHPGLRGRRLGDAAARLLQAHLVGELGYHRLQLEIYAFNERAIRHAERSGFVREGIRRKAYRRHGEWVDAVLFAVLAEDLELEEALKRAARDDAGVDRRGDTTA